MDERLFLLETVRQSWNDVGKPMRVTAAVSGGADSVALLQALAALSESEGMFLSVAHVDHGMRAASGQDAEFVREMCVALNLPCVITRVQVLGNSEDAARQARYEALAAACEEMKAPVLALAHHRRDQAETMLLRLFRGSGSAGLSAMAERSIREMPGREPLTLWRPLLNVSPETLRGFLTAHGIPWREDETNAGDAYLRNYVRHQVLPAVAARFPQAEEAVSRAARTLSAEDDFFRQAAGAFLNNAHNASLDGPCRWIRLGAFQPLHPALKRYVLRLACPVKLNWETTEALMALSPGEKMNLPENGRAECSHEYLHFLPPYALPPSPGRITVLPWQDETGDGMRWQAMPRGIYETCTLRFLAPGDRIHPLGAKGSKSMQDYFVDKKVPRPFRPYVPLLCKDARVIWAVGVGVGEEARVRTGDDAVLLRYDGYLPAEQ